jgi:hypothetical protein
LKQLQTAAGGDTQESLQYLSATRDWYLEKEDKNNYFFSAVQVINCLIRMGLYDEASTELQSNSFTIICGENKLFNSEKNYLSAVIASNKDSTGNPVDYLLDAYGFLAESTITELTWKVLFRLADLYYDRGNFPKSKEFNIYAVSVLDYIFNNIKNNKIKRLVVENPERKEAYNKLKLMQSNY